MPVSVFLPGQEPVNMDLSISAGCNMSEMAYKLNLKFRSQYFFSISTKIYFQGRLKPMHTVKIFSNL